jgi:signal peptidase I
LKNNNTINKKSDKIESDIIQSNEGKLTNLTNEENSSKTSLYNSDKEAIHSADLGKKVIDQSETQNLSSEKNDKKVVFTIKDLFDYGKIIIFALVISFLLNHYIIANARIPTGSMENTVMPNDRVLASRLSYLFDEPKRGDIIIFHFPDDESQEFLKRVIGLPGDIIDIVDGKVFVNESDVPLEEGYLKDLPNGNFGPYKVPEDSYFLMGDNRDDSYDSRYWDNTFVTRDEIVAKAIFRYYPTIKLLK